MKKQVKETREQWDDVPAKVVGRRRSGVGGWSNVTILQQRVNEQKVGRASWPKGVFRFHSHEEADAWLIQNIHFPKK